MHGACLRISSLGECQWRCGRRVLGRCQRHWPADPSPARTRGDGHRAAGRGDWTGRLLDLRWAQDAATEPRGGSEVVGGGGESHRAGIGRLAQAWAARDIDGPRRHAGLRAAPGPRRMATPTGGTDGTVVIYKKKCAHALAALCALETNEAPAR